MVRPLFLGSTTAAAAVFLLATPAAADEALPFACEAGVVLGGADAMNVVARGCEVAREKSTSGRVRIGVVATGPRVLVIATRIADASGVEQTARSDTASIEEAIAIVPRVVEAVLPKAPPKPPSSESLPPKPPTAESLPPMPATPSPQPTPATPNVPPEPARTVRVDVKSERGMRVLRSVDGTATWQTACEGSCHDIELPVDASYRVVDARGRVLKGFRLDPNGAERVEVDVSGRSTALDVVAVTGIIAGGALFIGGVSGQNDNVTLGGVVTGALGILGVALNGASVTQRAPRDVEPPPRVHPREARTFGGTLFSLSF
jgi:hypothetical protein